MASVKVSSCDVFIYVGGESDEWVNDINPHQIALSLMELLGSSVKHEEIVEGMEHEHDHDHDHEAELDEHIWLSLRNAKVICTQLAEVLVRSDPANSQLYSHNAQAYIAKLSDLDEAYSSVIAASKRKVMLFGDRFPFRYLADDYGLKYYAAFSGCSAETEASFETVIFLARKVDELGLPCVLTVEGSPELMAQIECHELSAGYGSIATAEGLTFSVNDGDYLCIVGSNGSGKTTLMRTILGLQPALSGQVKVNVNAKEIGYVPQQKAVQKDFPASVREVVMSGCQGSKGLRPFYSQREKQRATEAMNRMNIADLARKCFRELSGGQQQRVFLARALCASETIIFLDEPTAGLDAVTCSDMYRTREDYLSHE